MISKRFFYTVSAAFFWAVGIVLTRIILKSSEVGTYTLLLWVSIFSLPFWTYLLFTKRKEVKKLERKQIVLLACMGLISSFLVNVAEFFALTYSPAVNFSFLIRMVIPFTIILAYLLLGEKITRKKIILATLLLVGSYIFTTRGQVLVLTKGDVFTLIEALFIAFGNNILGQWATNTIHPSMAAIGTFFFGFLPITLLSIFMGGAMVPSQLGLVFLLALSIIILTLLRFQAYKHGNASYVTMVFSFTPVFVSFMAIPLLGETLLPIQIVGGVLIVGAAVLVEALKI